MTLERFVFVVACAWYCLMLAAFGNLDAAWAVWRTDEKLAAWVQAVGSVLAILAAVAVAGWQRRDERAQQQEAETASAQVIAVSILLKLNPVLGAISAAVHVIDYSRRHAVPVDAEAMLKRIDRLSLPDDSELLLLVRAHKACAIALAQGRNLLLNHAVVGLQFVNDANQVGQHAVGRNRALPLQEVFEAAQARFAFAQKALDEFAPR